MFVFTRTTLAALLLCGAASSQVVINEVLYDPVGVDTGAEVIEIHNQGAALVSLAGWSVCVNYSGAVFDRTYYFFPGGTTIPGGGFIKVHWFLAGVDTPTDKFTGTGAGFACLPGALMGNVVGSVSLYEGAGLCSDFAVSAFMRDFVQWGGSTVREPVAVGAGLWSAGTFLPVFPAGSVIAYDGSGNTVGDYFRDISSTFCAPNTDPGTATATNYGSGCAGTLGVPAIITKGGPPALGNQSWVIGLTGGNPGDDAILLFGVVPASLGLFQCTLLINPVPILFQLGPFTQSGTGTLDLPAALPHDPILLGVHLYFQWASKDTASPSGKFAFSNGLDVAF